jgi:hypothetical protein
MRPAPQPTMTDLERSAVQEAVAKSGMAIFLASGDMPEYAYADYLRSTWGVDVQHTYVAVQFAPTGEPGAETRFQIAGWVMDSSLATFTNHEIGRPLESVPVGMVAAAPVRAFEGEQKPGGVRVEPILKTRETDTVWAVRNLQALAMRQRNERGVRPDPDDLKSPFPLAVAAEDPEKKRIVVFGSHRFMFDQVANYRQAMLVGGRIVLARVFPGNTDLFLNALHWVSGNAERIAVGPRSDDVPRLTKLTPGFWTTFWKVFLIGVWPALILLLGAGVYLMRRR